MRGQRRRLAMAGEIERDRAAIRQALRQAAGERGQVAGGAEKPVQEEDRARAGTDARVGEQAHTSNTMRAGSSSASFTRTRKVTACSPSTRRWSYESATYIIGRITTWPWRATGRSSILCMPRMPDCGRLRVGGEGSDAEAAPAG